MDNQATRITLITTIICSFAIPIVLLVFGDRQLGGILLVVGLLITYRSLRALSNLGHERDPDRDRLASARQNQARTVMVPLLDENGVALDEAAAARLLQQARLRAGPRDTVIGVQRRPSEIPPQ